MVLFRIEPVANLNLYSYFGAEFSLQSLELGGRERIGNPKTGPTARGSEISAAAEVQTSNKCPVGQHKGT